MGHNLVMLISFSLRRRQQRLFRLLLFSVFCSIAIFIVVFYQKTIVLTQTTPTQINTPNIILLGASINGQLSQHQKRSKTDVRDISVPEGVQACRIPRLDINGSEVISFFKDPPPLNCDKKNEENWVSIDRNRRFRINPNAIKKHGMISCTIRYFHRVSDHKTKTDPAIPVQDGSIIDVSDYFFADCNGKDGSSRKHLLLTVVPNTTRTDVLSKVQRPNDWSGLDVYFIGYDSLSQMSFRRKLPKTVKFVEEVLEGVVLDGYNIVGDGTPQAFIPILTGSTEVELPLTRKRFKDAHYVDEVYPFIWKNFSDAGYITFYGEDAARIGTFTYRLKGFKNQPTDHYVRTFFQEAEPFFSNHLCFGSVPMHKEWFRYIGDFMRHYQGLAPRFLIAFHSLLSHDNINLVQVADEDTAAHLKEMYDTGALNNSLVIVMADHGHRFAKFRSTHQGQLEERLPFFAISFPKSFRETRFGRLAYENLKINKERLSTPFDIHATLMDILHWPSIEKLQQPNDLKERSMSLFREIPLSRTCSSAGIEPHWCTCLNWESAMKTGEQKKVSEMLAQTVVQAINNYTENERKLCAPLDLVSLENSSRLVPNQDLLKYKNVKDVDGFVPDLSGATKTVFAHYQLKFRTMPGNALYEATVQYDSKEDVVTVDLASISHVNKYGDLPHCIIDKNYFLAAYCVCYDKIRP